jgi:hypothetical protein
MIQISNQNLFGKVIAESLVKIDNNRNINSAEKMRWITAIAKAVTLIETQPEFIEFHPEMDMVTIWNTETNQVYNANGKCECTAGKMNQPCKHRACKQLIKNYLLAENPPVQSGATFAATASSSTQEKSEMANAFYQKPQPVSEKIRGFRI